jgi:WD40 repeat protein
MGRLRVYLSSTFEDLKKYRDAVFSAVEKAGLDVARMEGYTASDDRPLDKCLNDVAKSDIYVGIFAWRYGYQPPAAHGNPDARSITELEYRQAGLSNIKKLLFFVEADTQETWPEPFRDQGASAEKLRALRAELSREKSVSFFSNPDELATLVLAAIMRTGLSGRVYNVPLREPGFIPRPRLTASLIHELKTPPFALPLVVRGAPGNGKTSLVLDACLRPEVLSAFPDGVLWTVLGQRPDLPAVLNDLHLATTGAPAPAAGASALAQVLAKALAGRRCLIVVDDVWRSGDLHPFLALEGPRVLVTTRIGNIVEQSNLSGWPVVIVDQMEHDEAAALLGRGVPVDSSAVTSIRDLAKRLGCWPLLLNLAHARVLEELKESGQSLAQCVEYVTLLLDRFGVLSFDRDNPEARNAAVRDSVNVGLEFVERNYPGLSAKAAELSVFPEDTPIPVRAMADLWALDELTVKEKVLRPLNNIQTLLWERQTDTAKLHDMIRLALLPETSARPAIHRRLIDAWSDPKHLPHQYAWQWFGWHCREAQELGRLVPLLLDLDWLRGKLAATGINGLLTDFERIHDNAETRLVENVCRRSGYILGLDPSQLPGQLLARIPEGNPMRAGIEKAAQTVPTPWLRPLTASLAAERSHRWLSVDDGGTLANLAFSQNGRWAVHGELYGKVILWDLQGWRSLGPRFQAPPRSNDHGLAVSDDGHWCLYSDSVGGVHRLGDAGQIWSGHAHADLAIPWFLSISADGRRGLSGCSRGRLVAWDFETESHEVIWEGKGATGSNNLHLIRAVLLDATGSSALVSREDGSTRLVDLWPARERLLCQSSSCPEALARSPDNRIMATAASDGLMEVRDVNSPDHPIATFKADDQPCSLALSADATLLALGTTGGEIAVWDLRRKERWVRHKHAHLNPIVGVSLAGGRDRLLSADMLQIKEWELTALNPDPQSEGVRGEGQVKVLPDGLRVCAALADGRFGIWALTTGRLESTLEHTSGPAFGRDVGHDERISFAVDAPRILVWNDNLLSVWDLRDSRRVGFLRIAALGAAMNRDGSSVVYTTGRDVAVWSPDANATIVLGTHDNALRSSLALSPDGTLAITFGSDRSVWVWKLDATEPARYGLYAQHDPNSALFIGPGKVIVTTSMNELFLLDLDHPDPDPVPFRDRRKALLFGAVLDSSAKILVTSSHDMIVRVWDVSTLRCVAEFTGHVGTVEQVSVPKRRLLLRTGMGVVKILSLKDGSVVAAFQGDHLIRSCDSDSGVSQIAALDQSGQMHFIRLENS